MRIDDNFKELADDLGEHIRVFDLEDEFIKQTTCETGIPKEEFAPEKFLRGLPKQYGSSVASFLSSSVIFAVVIFRIWTKYSPSMNLMQVLLFNATGSSLLDRKDGGKVSPAEVFRRAF